MTRLLLSVLLGYTLLAVAGHARAATTPQGGTAAPHPDSAAAMKAMAEHEGIWKAVVPPVKMKGAFGSHDPIGLVAGKLIPADCSLNWTNPDTHELYCFSSATSLVYFLDSPQTYLAQARKNWRALRHESGKTR